MIRDGSTSPEHRGQGAAGPDPPDPPDPPGRSLGVRVRQARLRVEDATAKAQARLERERTHRRSVRIAVEFVEQDRARAGALLAGGVAFRVFLWLLPLSLVLVTGLGLVVGAARASTEDVTRKFQLSAAVGSTVSEAVRSSHRGRILLFLVGLFLVVWAGLAVVRALQVVSGLAWAVPPRSRRNPLLRSLSFSAGVLLLLIAQAVAGMLYGASVATDVVVSIGLLACLVAVAAWGLHGLPHPGVPWSAMLPGALLIAVGVEILRLATMAFFAAKLERVSNLYGALGLAVVLLTWLYSVGRLVVAGITINATLWRQRTQASGTAGSPQGDDASATAPEQSR
jgi:uncharacterized BrkB/YihY/UPF0761 family membrane protein